MVPEGFNAAAQAAAFVASKAGEAAGTASEVAGSIGRGAGEAAGRTAGFATLGGAEAAGRTAGFVTLGGAEAAGRTVGFATLNGGETAGKTGFATLTNQAGSPDAGAKLIALTENSSAEGSSLDVHGEPGSQTSVRLTTKGPTTEHKVFGRQLDVNGEVVQDSEAAAVDATVTRDTAQRSGDGTENEATAARQDGRQVRESQSAGKRKVTLDEVADGVVNSDNSTVTGDQRQDQQREGTSDQRTEKASTEDHVVDNPSQAGKSETTDTEEKGQDNPDNEIVQKTSPSTKNGSQTPTDAEQPDQRDPLTGEHEQFEDRLILGSGPSIRVRISDEPATADMTGDIVTDAINQADEMRDTAHLTEHPDDQAVSERANQIAISLGQAQAISETSGMPVEEVLQNLSQQEPVTDYDRRVAEASTQALDYYHRQEARLAERAEGEAVAIEVTGEALSGSTDAGEHEVFTASADHANPDAPTAQNASGNPDTANATDATNTQPDGHAQSDSSFAEVQDVIDKIRESQEAAEKANATETDEPEAKGDTNASAKGTDGQPDAPRDAADSAKPEGEEWEWKNDYYDMLGVGKNATQDEIKSAYRKLARELHPDVNPKNAEQFKNITSAYNTLSDETKRQEFDEMQEWEQQFKNPSTGRPDAGAGGHGEWDTFVDAHMSPPRWDFEDDWTVQEGEGFYFTRTPNDRQRVRFDLPNDGRGPTVFAEDLPFDVLDLSDIDQATWGRLANQFTADMQQAREDLLTNYDNLWAERRAKMTGSEFSGDTIYERRFFPRTLRGNGTNWRRHGEQSGQQQEGRDLKESAKPQTRYEEVSDRVKDNKTQKVMLEERLRQLKAHPIRNARRIQEIQFDLARVDLALSRDRLARLYRNPLRAIIEEAIESGERPETPSDAAAALTGTGKK
jgi:curved DNA-binding protein CbpA